MISEATPLLELEGWHHAQLARDEWISLSHPPPRLPVVQLRGKQQTLMLKEAI
jgi:hypothetical protein